MLDVKHAHKMDVDVGTINCIIDLIGLEEMIDDSVTSGVLLH